MTGQAWRLCAWGLSLLAIAGGAAVLAATRMPLQVATATAAPPAPAVRPTAAATRAPADAAVIARALFRLSRAPAPIPFDPRGQPATTPTPSEPLPAFVLAGLLLGEPRAALIRGIPGQQTLQLLAEGDEAGGVRLVRLDSAGAVLVWRGDTVRVTLESEGGR